MTMKAGVIGCGSIGRRYVNWLLQLDCHVGVYDPDMTKTEGFDAASVTIFADMDALITWATDAVVIASPPRHHYAPFMAALAGGARVLVEKPLAASLVEAASMREAAERHAGMVFGVCNMRFHPAVQAVRKNLPSIGRLLYGRAYFSHRLAQMRPAGLAVFAAEAKEGGGVILDCVHDIDLLTWMLGPLEVVGSWTGRIGPDVISAEDYAEIQLLSLASVRVSLHLDFVARWKRRGCEFVGTEATLLWQSEGRRPETAAVHLNYMDNPALVFQSEAVDSNIEYINMLHSFLTDGRDLQTIQEAEHVLQLAHACGAALE